VFELSGDGTVREYTVEPKDFGVDVVSVESICGGDPKVNLATFVQLLDQKLPETHPIVSFVLFNAAALLKISGKATSFLDGMAMAKAALYSGRARHAFNAFQQALQNIAKK
jgi:anthranilate phosphoribosyltransferase